MDPLQASSSLLITKPPGRFLWTIVESAPITTYIAYFYRSGPDGNVFSENEGSEWPESIHVSPSRVHHPSAYQGCKTITHLGPENASYPPDWILWVILTMAIYLVLGHYALSKIQSVVLVWASILDNIREGMHNITGKASDPRTVAFIIDFIQWTPILVQGAMSTYFGYCMWRRGFEIGTIIPWTIIVFLLGYPLGPLLRRNFLSTICALMVDLLVALNIIGYVVKFLCFHFNLNTLFYRLCSASGDQTDHPEPEPFRRPGRRNLYRPPEWSGS